MNRQRVLIPLDGSPFSRQIVPHVCRLLGAGEHQILLLRVAEPLDGIYGAPPRPVSFGWTAPMHERMRDLEYSRHPVYASQLEQSERTALAQDLETDRRILEQAGYLVTTVVRFGDPANEIVDLARLENVDLVAMATHGRAGLRHMVLGSVAEQVLARLAIPVLLFRPMPENTN